MVSKYRYNELTWIDLDTPTPEEVRQIMQQYSINPLVANELLKPTLRPQVDFHRDHIYLILHFPAVTHSHGSASNVEIDFIVGKNFLITTHYEHIDPLHEFSKVFEVHSLLDKSDIGNHGGYLFFYIIRELYKHLLHDLDVIDDRLEEIEERIFRGEESLMVRKLSYVSRDLLNIRQAIRPHKSMLTSFSTAARDLFGERFAYHTQTILGDYYKVFNLLEGHKETLNDLRITNDSLLTTKTNEIMKNLTVVAFITFPLTLIVGTFGMNSEHMPIIGNPYDFWIIMAIMALSAIGMFIYFRAKKWL